MKVKDYGDMLAQVIGKKCLSYIEFGSYQGDWMAAIEDGDNIEIWKGYYGSCAGCDFIQSEGDCVYEDGSYDYKIDDEKAKEHFKEDKPFIVIPKSVIKTCSLEEFESLLPANTREEIYDFEPTKLLKEIRKSI